MRKYSDILGTVSPTARSVQRAGDIVAALAPPAPGASTAMVPATKNEPAKESTMAAAMGLAPGLAVGVAAALMFGRQHPVLAFLGGHAIGSTAYPIYKGGDDRKKALCQLAVEGAGVAGALAWSDHPIWGWGLGLAAGAVATSLVKDSPTMAAWKQLKSKVA